MFRLSSIKGIIPLRFRRENRANGITLSNRISALLFGSPNWRRGCGVISTAFELDLILEKAVDMILAGSDEKPLGHSAKKANVFSLDRRGMLFSERLPRIWLSEAVSNTKADNGRRVFVECYPCGDDKGGRHALELAERYLSEGFSDAFELSDEDRLECLKAAEILLLHAVERRNRKAVGMLEELYAYSLPLRDRWLTVLEKKAKHSRISSDRECLIDKPAVSGSETAVPCLSI